MPHKPLLLHKPLNSKALSSYKADRLPCKLPVAKLMLNGALEFLLSMGAALPVSVSMLAPRILLPSFVLPMVS